MTVDQVRQTLMNIRDEVQRRDYLADPDGAIRWVNQRLGEHVWSKQRDILRSIQVNRRTAVPSAFGTGKSWIAARIAAFWIENHPPGEAFAVTTATTGAQVKAIMWRELARAHARGGLKGHLNQTEWYLPRIINGKVVSEIVAFGRKPGDMDPTALQGIHARYVLVVIDEAAGINSGLWNAAEGLIVNEHSRILAIGNPENASSSFAEACAPGSGWQVVRIPADSTPNFTGEDVPHMLRDHLISRVWVEEKRRTWGESNPLWIAKVLAEFPETQVDGLIPIAWIRRAQDRFVDLQDAGQLDAQPGPNELGADVGQGGDRNVVAHRRGIVGRIVRRDHEPDTMRTTGNFIADMRAVAATKVKVDYIGIGAGAVDRGRELGHPFLGVKVSEKAGNTEQFANQKAEGFWGLRLRFQDDAIAIDPRDEDLAAQLVAMRYQRNSRSQIQIESKEDYKRRTKGGSPDDADALMLAFYDPPEAEAMSLTW